VINYLKTRRSSLAMNLSSPAPDAEEVKSLIEIAARVPDHGKLSPWRFVEYRQDERDYLVEELMRLSDAEADASRRESREKEINRFKSAPLVIGVVSKTCAHPKVPEFEQVLSAGAATMVLLIAANGMGYEAQWLTGWFTRDPAATKLLGISRGEQIAAMIHIGSSDVAKNDRTRPQLNDIFSVHPPIHHKESI